MSAGIGMCVVCSYDTYTHHSLLPPFLFPCRKHATQLACTMYIHMQTYCNGGLRDNLEKTYQNCTVFRHCEHRAITIIVPKKHGALNLNLPLVTNISAFRFLLLAAPRVSTANFPHAARYRSPPPQAHL